MCVLRIAEIGLFNNISDSSLKFLNVLSFMCKRNMTYFYTINMSRSNPLHYSKVTSLRVWFFRRRTWCLVAQRCSLLCTLLLQDFTWRPSVKSKVCCESFLRMLSCSSPRPSFRRASFNWYAPLYLQRSAVEYEIAGCFLIVATFPIEEIHLVEAPALLPVAPNYKTTKHLKNSSTQWRTFVKGGGGWKIFILKEKTIKNKKHELI